MQIERLVAGQHELAVTPEIGAGLAWLKTRDGNGTDWHWLRQTPSANRPTPRDLGLFLLAPFSNRIANARFRLRDRDIQLSANFPPEHHAIHGVAWSSAWQLDSKTERVMQLSLVCDDHPVWPWQMRMEVAYELDETGLSIRLGVTNLDSTKMPCGLGIHPYFPRTDGVSVFTQAAAIVRNDDQMVPTGLDKDHSALNTLRDGHPLPVGLDNGLFQWSGSATIHWPEPGRSLRLEVVPTYKWAVVFTPRNALYFCFEPVSHQTNAHNGALPGVDDTGLIWLRPRESQSATFRLDLN
ncbi:MAG: aldose 1-epimerase [Pseudomonadota bacterium]